MFDKINPTTVTTVTKVLCIDSLFRQNLYTTEPSNFIYKLSEPINNVVSIRLSSIELPNNWYLFAKYDHSNIFTITCYNVPDLIDSSNVLLFKNKVVHVIELPEGNYLADKFELALKNYFANTGGGLQYIGVTVNEFSSKTEFYSGVDTLTTTGILTYPYNPYTVEIPEGKGDFYFKIDFTIPDLPLYPLYKTIGWTLGFRKYEYIVKYGDNATTRIIESQNQTYFAYLESESSYGSSFFQYLFLELDDYQKNVASNAIVSYNGDYNLSNNIFAKIVITSGQYTSITDNGSDLMFKKRNYFGPVRLEKLHFRILTRFGDVIDLNGNNFSLTLEIDTLYS